MTTSVAQAEASTSMRAALSPVSPSPDSSPSTSGAAAVPRVGVSRSKLSAASTPFLSFQPERAARASPALPPYPYQQNQPHAHAHPAQPMHPARPTNVNGVPQTGMHGGYGLPYAYDGYGQWKAEAGPSHWQDGTGAGAGPGYYPIVPRHFAQHGGIYLPVPTGPPFLPPAPFDQALPFPSAPSFRPHAAAHSPANAHVPPPRLPRTRKHRPPPPKDALAFSLGPNARPPPGWTNPAAPGAPAPAPRTPAPPPTAAPEQAQGEPEKAAPKPPSQPPAAPPPIVPAATPPPPPPTAAIPASVTPPPPAASAASLPATPSTAVPLSYASLKTPSTPARDLASAATAPSSSSHSSPILTPLSPATTTTTLDEADVPPAVPIPSSPTPPASALTPAAPAGPKKSWADLVRSPNGSSANGSLPSSPHAPGSSAPGSPIKEYIHRPLFVSSVPGRRTLAHALEGVEHEFAAPTIVPRGLINNGNLCFTNAILQVLVYTTPFWNLLGRIRAATAADLSGKTPSMDAMIHFLDEFRPAPRVEVVSRHRSKSSLGLPSSGLLPSSIPEDAFIPPPASDWSDPFVPEEVYDSLKPNKRFDAMRRGHQEDAEEFLGFFLDTLHDEILATIDRVDKVDKEDEDEPEKGEDRPIEGETDQWLEVGSKGRTATTRTTETRESPITRIFGGQLRSVLRCAGQKDSITLEPYQRLQLDIQPHNVRTVEDALTNLTLPEPLPDFVSRSGVRVDATKQVYLETYPPVLILHLKRFLYDNVGGVQKSGKVIGYGTELVIREDIIAPTKRTGKPVTYQLYGVVYHHGKSASGGHYTVAVRQQINSNSWVHIDDTSIRPISPGDVAVERPGSGEGKAFDAYQDKGAYLLCYRLA